MDNFDIGYWNGKPIKDMDYNHLVNSINYLIRHPGDPVLELENWRDKIKELVDALYNNVLLNYDPMTDWDFHKD